MILVQRISLLVAALCFTTLVLAAPRNYQECILQATDQGMANSGRNIGRIKVRCAEQFPDSAPTTIGDRLSDKKLQEIDIFTNRDSDGNINGTVYNGNADTFITRLHIILTPVRGDSVQDFFDSEEFDLNLQIKPFDTKRFSIAAGKTKIDGTYRWNLIQAWGY